MSPIILFIIHVVGVAFLALALFSVNLGRIDSFIAGVFILGFVSLFFWWGKFRNWPAP